MKCLNYHRKAVILFKNSTLVLFEAISCHDFTAVILIKRFFSLLLMSEFNIVGDESPQEVTDTQKSVIRTAPATTRGSTECPMK